MTVLIVILAESPDAPSVWGIFGKDSAAIVRSGIIEPGRKLEFAEGEAPAATWPAETWVVVSGASVLARTVALPAQTEVQLRKAAAFMLEDDLAVDSAEMHFALAPESANEGRAILAVSRDTMRSWLARLESMALKADILVPDFLAVTAAPHEAVVLGRAGMVSVRLGPGAAAFTIEPTVLDWVLGDSFKNIRSLRLITGDAEALLRGPLKAYRGIAKLESLSDPGLLQMAHAAVRGGAHINLLQGDYAPRRDWAAVGRDWRRTAILVGATAVLALTYLVVDSMRLHRQAEFATARTEAVFRRVFPDVKRVVNPRAQIRAHLQELKARGSTGFLQTSTMLFAVVSETDGSEIQVLRFDAKGGETSVTMSLPSYDVIERINTAIRKNGGTVQEGGARQDGDRIVTDIVVRVP